ncbi:MAG: hypothetical protein ACTSQI_07660 [Candidatus Helarchaeota archaeon]
MTGIVDIFGDPFIIPIVLIGLLAIMGAFYKSKKMRALGKFCGYMLFFYLWFIMVDCIIMPNVGTDSEYLRWILYSIPLFVFLKRLT